MKGLELKKLAKEIAEKKEYIFYAVRFCGQDYNEGDVIRDKSKCLEMTDEWISHDDCEWPDYGTDEYDRLPEVDGVFGYPVSCLDREFEDDAEISSGRLHDTAHCYIIATDELDDDFIPSTGSENVYKDPVVIKKIY